LDSLSVFGADTLRVDLNKLHNTYSIGVLATDTGGKFLWDKYVTQDNYYFEGIYFRQIPLPNLVDQISNVGTLIYNYVDTLANVDTAGQGINPDSYQKILSQIDDSGNIVKEFVADMGAVGSNMRGYDRFPTGAIDWQGNIYVGGTITNYLATPADSVVNTDPNSGDFFIAKIGTSDCSCTSPGAQFSETTSGDTVRFMGSTIHYHDSIVWRLGDGTSYTGDTFTHIYAPDSSYIVTEIAYSQCGIDSVTRQITVTGTCIIPVGQFLQTTYGDTVTFASLSINADSVHWRFGDGSTSNLDTVTHIYTHDSTYTVVMIAYNGCGADSLTWQITIGPSGISVTGTDHTQLYPNPTNDVLYLDVSGAAKIGFISANGTMLWDGPRQLSQAGTYVFDISGYSAGVYYMVIQYPDGQTETLPVTKK
jgi:PKD repeat protein